MKGTLTKLYPQWMVRYDTFQNDHSYPLPAYNFLPVHPDDLDSEVIRWANNGSLDNNKVEFEIKYYWDGIMEQPIEVAKLIKPEYPELEGTMNLCNDIIEKRTGKMTEEEWQAAEKAQTSTKIAMYSIEWLEERFQMYLSWYEGHHSAKEYRLEDFAKDFQQAKEMHKQEIIDAWIATDNELQRLAAEQYYQETFVSKGSDDHKYYEQSRGINVDSFQSEAPKKEDYIVKVTDVTSSQIEISDEEIEKAAAHYEPMVTRRAWVSACKWYREQLKTK